MQDTRTPALINIGAAALNIAVDIAFVAGLGLGVQGLALGHAISYVFSTIVCLVILRKRLGGLDGRRIGASLVRVVPSAIVTAATAWAVAQWLGGVVDVERVAGRVIQVAVAVLAGVLAYAGCVLILRIDEADEVRSATRRRFRR
jgi:putative peptidoglycan lipid II flippase